MGINWSLWITVLYAACLFCEVRLGEEWIVRSVAAWSWTMNLVNEVESIGHIYYGEFGVRVSCTYKLVGLLALFQSHSRATLRSLNDHSDFLYKLGTNISSRDCMNASERCDDTHPSLLSQHVVSLFSTYTSISFFSQPLSLAKPLPEFFFQVYGKACQNE